MQNSAQYEQSATRILDALPEGIIVQDCSGRLMYANTAAATLVGYPSSESLLAVPLEELLRQFERIDADWQSFPLARLPAQQVVVGETSDELTLRFHVQGTGEERWAIVKATPVLNERGEVPFAVNSFHDVTRLKQSEYELRRQQAELHDFVENAVVSLHWVDADGCILWANQAELDLLGYTREEYFGHHIGEFYVDQNVIHEILNCLVNGEILNNREARLRCKDGSIRDVLISSNVMWEDGKFRHTRCFTRDITPLKQSQSALEQNQRRLQAIFDHVQSAILIADDAGRYVDANPAATTLTGYSRDELLRLAVADLAPDAGQGIMAESWSAFLESQNQAGEYSIRRKDGAEVETEFRAVANVLPGLHLSLMQDVSKRKRTEREVRERFAQLRAIYDLSSAVNRADGLQQIYTIALDGLVNHLGADRGSILLFDPDGVMRFKAWRGLSDSYRQQTEGHSPWTRETQDPQPVLVPHVEQEPGLAALQPVILAEGICALGFVPLLSDRELLGKFMIYYDQPHEFKDTEVQFVQTLASHVAFAIERQANEQARTDLLQRERVARLEAEKADALKLQFLAMVSHELRTPLASIKGFTSTLMAEDVSYDAPSQRDFIRIIDEEADKLTDLIAHLIDVSRLQAGSLRIQPVAQEFATALNVSSFQLQTLTRDHQLLLDLPVSLPPVLMDEQRIAQVLVNLTHNAVKYSPAHTRITIQAREAGALLQVKVCDEGEGIPPDMRDTIFEAFRQVDKASKSGAGLGLAICKGLVEAHGGRIWIEDHAPQGTCIVFTLPTVASSSPILH